MIIDKNKIATTTTCDLQLAKAKELARQLNLPFVRYNLTDYQFLLTVTTTHLELQETTLKNVKPICIDFLAPNLTYRTKHGGGNKQLLAKAVGIKNGLRPTILDTTAGLGVDAFILASLGCNVIMLERSPVIGALLQDGLDRFRKSNQNTDLKLELQIVQAADYLNEIFYTKFNQPDIIYLDPMYPKRQKTALGKRTMRILHELVGTDEDAEKILTLACKCANKRVVVKRPSYAKTLGEIKPDLTFSAGGSCRYDIYLMKTYYNLFGGGGGN